MYLVSREVIKRGKINKYGKLGFIKVLEYAVIDTLDDLNTLNYRKRIKFDIIKCEIFEKRYNFNPYAHLRLLKGYNNKKDLNIIQSYELEIIGG